MHIRKLWIIQMVEIGIYYRKKDFGMFNLETISPKMLDYYVDSKRAFIIDLRTEEEYAKGHIRNAHLIPYTGGRFPYMPPKQYEIVLYCERGSLSLLAARELAREGYRVRSVIGGIHAYKGRNLVTDE